MILLLNILIAIMNTRYAEVKNKSTPFPRQDCKIDKKDKKVVVAHY